MHRGRRFGTERQVQRREGPRDISPPNRCWGTRHGGRCSRRSARSARASPRALPLTEVSPRPAGRPPPPACGNWPVPARGTGADPRRTLLRPGHFLTAGLHGLTGASRGRRRVPSSQTRRRRLTKAMFPKSPSESLSGRRGVRANQPGSRSVPGRRDVPRQDLRSLRVPMHLQGPR